MANKSHVPTDKTRRTVALRAAVGVPHKLIAIVALLDETIVDFEAIGIRSNRSTVGHRVHSPESFDIMHAEDYENVLLVHSVIVDPAKRHLLRVSSLRGSDSLLLSAMNLMSRFCPVR